MGDAVRRLLLTGVMGAALAAPIISPASAQTSDVVPTDPQGFSPFNTHTTIDQPVIRNAPALGLSSIYGLNPCSLGASAGVTTPLFGIGGAISTTDKDCETRNTAALAITGLKDEAAGREVMCIIKEFREAVARLGRPCIADQSHKGVASNTPQSAIPQQQPPPAVILTSAAKPATAIAPGAPAFCQTPGLVLNSYPECTEPHASTDSSEKHSTAAGHDRHIVRAVEKKPVEKKPEPDAAQIPADEPVNNRFKLEPIAAQPPNMVATLMQRRATMLAAGDTSAVGLIDERLASLETTPSAQIATARPAQPQPVPTIAQQAPTQQLPGLVATLMERGAAMIAAGDIVAARLFYERAAAAGSGQAAIEIAKTYDPRLHPTGANLALAKDWYRRAMAMADAEAINLSRLASR